MCYNRILGGLGTGHICMKDTTYIVKNNEVKKVKKDDIKKYFKKGYEQRYPYGPRKWVTKENRTEAVYLHELENYLSSGWKLGRGKSMTSNTNWVTKDGLSKMVKVTELQQYLNKGYKQGRNIEKKIKVYKDNNTIMIDKLELDKYLKNGYKKGLHYKTVSGFKNWIKDKKGNIRTIHKNGITKRILKEQLSQDNIILTGYGLFASRENLEQRHKNFNTYFGYHNYNYHNQYAQTISESGIIGLILLILLLGTNIYKAIRSHYFLFISFSILIILWFATESVLWVQRGVVFFSVFYCLFAHLDYKKKLNSPFDLEFFKFNI
jgi:hypothetical protein